MATLVDNVLDMPVKFKDRIPSNRLRGWDYVQNLVLFQPYAVPGMVDPCPP